MHSVLFNLYNEENIPEEQTLDYKLDGNTLRKIVEKGPYKDKFSVRKYENVIYLIKNPRGNFRPQITYRLSLDKISQTFERLRELKDVDDFLNSISAPENTIAMPRYSSSSVVPSLVFTNKMKRYNILNFLRTLDIPARMNNLNFTENAKGFTFLFLHYWVNIFNNNQLGRNDLLSKQPGLKPFLYIMSRIPLSELYDNALTPEEQDQFQALIDPILETNFDIEEHLIRRLSKEEVAGNVCQLRQYIVSKGENRQFNDDAGFPILTLREWFDSIVDPDKRLDGKDKLSPAPGLALNHGMGAYEWKNVMAPLIEVRGYTALFGEKVKKNPAEVVIGKLYNFIIQEYIWFFDLADNKEKEKEK